MQTCSQNYVAAFRGGSLMSSSLAAFANKFDLVPSAEFEYLEFRMTKVPVTAILMLLLFVATG